jgi:hypothetical protein
MKSFAAIGLFILSLLCLGSALEAKESFAPAPKFGFGTAVVDAGTTSEVVETRTAPLRKLDPGALGALGR